MLTRIGYKFLTLLHFLMLRISMKDEVKEMPTQFLTFSASSSDIDVVIVEFEDFVEGFEDFFDVVDGF